MILFLNDLTIVKIKNQCSQFIYNGKQSMFARVLGLMELWSYGLMEPKLEKLISTFVILKHLMNFAVNANISFLG